MLGYLQMEQQARMKEIEREVTQRRRFAHAEKSQSRLARLLHLPLPRKHSKHAA